MQRNGSAIAEVRKLGNWSQRHATRLTVLPQVTILSASRRSSLALWTVVSIRSCWMSCDTMVLSMDHRCADVLLSFLKATLCFMVRREGVESPVGLFRGARAGGSSK